MIVCRAKTRNDMGEGETVCLSCFGVLEGREKRISLLRLRGRVRVGVQLLEKSKALSNETLISPSS